MRPVKNKEGGQQDTERKDKFQELMAKWNQDSALDNNSEKMRKKFDFLNNPASIALIKNESWEAAE